LDNREFRAPNRANAGVALSLSPPARGEVRPFYCAQGKLRREGVGVKQNASIHTSLTRRFAPPSPARGEGREPLTYAKLPLTRIPLHNPSVSQTCHPERQRRTSSFSSSHRSGRKTKVLQFAANTPLLQDDNVRSFGGSYAKLPLTRRGGAASRRRDCLPDKGGGRRPGGLIKPTLNFVAVPLAKGDKVGFTLSHAS
jgi:hypothetical protein